MKKNVSLVLGFFLLLLSTQSVAAIYNPTFVANNRYGIHLTDASELKDAAALVNGGGGDWGYVTFVIQKGERDTSRWTKTFEELRKLHLIPLVRIATKPILAIWEKPSVDEIDGWVSFLNSLPWPTQNRYVIIGNEPNHASEWGGTIKPEEYAIYLKTFSEKLKKESNKFYVLPAGLDSSAPNSLFTMDEAYFIRRMLIAEPQIFDAIDGWTSHSYPNPAFKGSPKDSGRTSIKSYQWELEFLKSLGTEKDFKVFITETGWAHNVKNESYGNVNLEQVGSNFDYAFNNVWTDNRIVAVTPFIINYQAWPFDIFSWKDKEGNFYDFYYEVMNFPKEQGRPLLEPTPTPEPSPRLAPLPAPSPEATPAPKESFLGQVFSNIKAFLLQYIR